MHFRMTFSRPGGISGLYTLGGAKLLLSSCDFGSFSCQFDIDIVFRVVKVLLENVLTVRKEICVFEFLPL